MLPVGCANGTGSQFLAAAAVCTGMLVVRGYSVLFGRLAARSQAQFLERFGPSRYLNAGASIPKMKDTRDEHTRLRLHSAYNAV